MNIKKQPIQSLYNYLEKNSYPYLSYSEEWNEGSFEINYKGRKFIIGKSNNLDENEEQLRGSTFDYYLRLDSTTVYEQPNLPKKFIELISNILTDLKSKGKMENGGEVLLAPNGKPSNLTPEQYRLVRTPEFKAWFGDWENDAENASKVVDDNGEPLVLWHYARRLQYELDKFFVFRTTEQLGSHFGSLSQVSNLSPDAEYKIDKNELDFRFYEVFLNIRNPIRMLDTPYWENQDLLDALSEKYNIYENKEWQDGERYAKHYAEKYSIDGIIYLNRYETKNDLTDSQKKLTDKEFRKLVTSAEDSWIAFNPTQIKLADGTNTTFDSNNPDIRFDNGGGVEKLAFIQKNENGFYWLYAINDKGDNYKDIDGDKRLYVVKDMAERFGYKLVSAKQFNDFYKIDDRFKMYENRRKFDLGGTTMRKPKSSVLFGELTLTSEQVENELSRKLHWWNDDVVSINGIEYKKVFLRNEYKRL